jgi:hypothetical protein
VPRVDPVIRALDLGLASMSDVCRVLVRATDWLAASDRPQTMQRFAGRFGGMAASGGKLIATPRAPS